MRYDRTLLRNAARGAGDSTPSDISRRLEVAPATAWRLFHGHTAPSARVAAAVERAYGVPASQLCKAAA
ncbi:XRE family transcriptional regulator [Streptomyces sp. Marseille-Q5077]|uniref:XRE family transcriptional regulator n=1 Tax=Streptomyces TaxID=1883 RepID=UPI00177E2CB4|nr:XRE family transcriptional regulator [Streptomyces luteolifulvus]